MGKKILKISIIVFALFIILLIATPFLFKGKIIEGIKKEANKSLNATLTFDNSIGLNLFKNFPNLNLSISNLCIIGKGEFENDTLIYAKTTQVVMDLKTLWDTKEIPIRKLFIDEPLVNIIYHKNGNANYDIFLPDSNAADTSHSRLKAKMDVYELKNATIRFEDQSNGFKVNLKGMDHLGSGNFDDMVFDLNTKTDIASFTMSYGGVAYLDQVKSRVDAMLHMDLNKYRFEFKENLISLNEMALSLNGFVALPNDSDIDMDLSIKSNQSEFKKLLSILPSLYKNKFESLQASGDFGFEANLKGIYNDFSFPGYGLHLGIRNGAFKYPELPDQVSDINVTLHVNNADGITDHTIIDLQSLHAKVGSDVLDARVKVSNPVSNAYIDGEAKGKLNLANLTRIVPLADTKLSGLLSVDAGAKGNIKQLSSGNYEKLNASGSFIAQDIVYESKGSLPVKVQSAAAQLSPMAVTLTECKASVSHSDFDATGKLENFFGYMLRNEKIKGILNLKSNNLDINELMGPTATTTAPDTSSLKPIKVPENIDFVVTSKISKLKYDKYDISNLVGNVKINDGIVALENTSMEMLDAKFGVNGKYNSLDIKKPLFDLDFVIQDLGIQKAFNTFNSVKALAPLAEFISGKLSTKLHYSSAFDENFMPMLNSINSLGNLNIPKASIEGCKPLEMLADQLQLNNLKKFDLQNVLLNFIVSKGEIAVKPFKTKWNNYNLELLEGITGLDKSMNFHFKLSVPRSEFGASNTALNTMVQQANAKSPIPIKLGDIIDVEVFIKGSFLKPEISTNIRDMANKALDELKDAMIKRAQDSLNNLKLQAETKARAEAMKLVADAQIQADKIKAEAAAYANSVKQQGYKAADSLVNSVTNPIGKIAAKAAAEKLKQEADAKAQKIINDANAKADALVEDAKRKASGN